MHRYDTCMARREASSHITYNQVGCVRCMISLAASLEPIARIELAGGPMNASPAAAACTYASVQMRVND